MELKAGMGSIRTETPIASTGRTSPEVTHLTINLRLCRMKCKKGA